MPKLITRQEGANVIVILDDKLVLNLPWDVALALAQDITQKAKAAEEIAKAEQIILDNAILFRSGVPIGLSNNRDIIAETIKEAQHNPLLRRHMAGGIKSQAIVGTPVLLHGKGPRNG